MARIHYFRSTSEDAKAAVRAHHNKTYGGQDRTERGVFTRHIRRKYIVALNNYKTGLIYL